MAIYVVGVDQNFDRMTVAGALFSKALVWCAVSMIPAYLSGLWWAWLLPACLMVAVIYRTVTLWPGWRSRGLRHAFMVYATNGYWHRAEYIAGRGEVIGVLTDPQGRPIPAHQGAAIESLLRQGTGIKWDTSTADAPRGPGRVVEVRGAPANVFRPFAFYPRTSVGFLNYRLGIHDPRINKPAELLAFLEQGEKAFDTTERPPALVRFWRWLWQPLFITSKPGT